jgi:hypothetical protein
LDRLFEHVDGVPFDRLGDLHDRLPRKQTYERLEHGRWRQVLFYLWSAGQRNIEPAKFLRVSR